MCNYAVVHAAAAQADRLPCSYSGYSDTILKNELHTSVKVLLPFF